MQCVSYLAPLRADRAKLYSENLSGTPREIKVKCTANKGNIELRNTKSYFTEIIEAHASKLGIEDLIPIAKELEALLP